ncbi:MAG: heme o synthase [Bacteroidetes bacterium]|nr:heme o synthase [Bacteroidota bacterium]MCW5896969.1 heme o synthase [Bacteroidota bacterium]
MRSNIENNGTIAIERSKVADYITLTKPELTFLSVVTALGGFYLGVAGSLPIGTLLHTLFGTLLVGGGAGALNQYIEREYDAMMRRTENRPLPSGRLSPTEVVLFGSLLSIAGVVELTVFANPLSGFLAIVTLVTYLFLYTPLKRISWVSTIVGGIPGALPPMIGWAAARNEITIEAWILFGILFFWQMPHFFSLAWMYRKDYERAGYPMLTVLDAEGKQTSRQILLFCVGLIPVSLMLTLYGGLGIVYFAGALVTGGVFLYFGIELLKTKSNKAARKMFFASLVYLPVLLAFMVIDRI